MDKMLKEHKLNHIYNALKVFVNTFFNREVPLVVGAGNPDAGLVLVGEAPGKHEVIQGKPFVGQAGKNLDNFIDKLEIKRSDLYITNIVKFRPYKVNPDTGRESNRPPTKEEIRISTDYLFQELTVIQPKLVVTLGNVALKCILGDDMAAIGKLHGSPLQVTAGDIYFTLFPLYHPASIIYNRDLRVTYDADLLKLKAYICNDLLLEG